MIVSSQTGQWAAFKERSFTPILEALNEEKNFGSKDRYYTSKLLVIYFFRKFIARAGQMHVVNQHCKSRFLLWDGPP
jgi:hypothetical protein